MAKKSIKLKEIPFDLLLIIWMLILISLPIIFSSISMGDPYTAIYFDSPEALPILASDRQQALFFTIENHEGRDMIYNYIVKVKSDLDIETATDSVIIIKDGKESIPLLFNADKAQKITVMLMETGQEIHFSVLENAPVWEADQEDDEYRPLIQDDIPWEKQDPLVRWYYKFV